MELSSNGEILKVKCTLRIITITHLRYYSRLIAHKMGVGKLSGVLGNDKVIFESGSSEFWTVR